MSANKPPSRRSSLSDALPIPTDEATLHSTQVLEKIQDKIQAAGSAIRFDEYMHAALYLPDLGYYRCGTEKFGALGDFTTAPEVSALFAQCLAQFIHANQCGSAILEVGAGSGQLAVDVLLALQAQDSLPQHYYILELSRELRARQQQNIQQALPDFVNSVQWLDDLPTSFDGVVIANELLDAMPVRRFHLKQGKTYEQYIAQRNGVLYFEDVPLDEPRLVERLALLQQQTSLAEVDDYTSEVNFYAEDWISTLAQRCHTAVILLIDYGYPRSAYYHAQRSSGTLMCHYQHRAHSDPLVLTGIQDMTAHVDFTAMADAALAGDLQVAGFTTQAHFLMNLGLLDKLATQTPSDASIQMVNEIKRLTLPTEMGEQFKVMALTKNIAHLQHGFEQYDLRHLL